MTVDPLSILAALVLEDGRTWGEASHSWQRDDAKAVLDGPRRNYLLRGRGMSKSTDVAGMTLALLLSEAPKRSRSLVYAVDTEQAGLFMDALAGLVQRTPDVIGAVELGARSLKVRATEASLTVEASDGASAFGARPWITVVDELGAWPNSTNHRRLWSAITSAVPKVPDSRLVVIGTAGSPLGIGAQVWEQAQGSAHWRTAQRPGPSPWWSTEDIEALQGDLTASEWGRLVLCEWSEGEDTLTSAEDVAACIRPTDAVLSPDPRREYVAGLDVGTRRDLTALVVGHIERRSNGRVVVIDRAQYWRPSSSRGGRVDLSEVEAFTLALCRMYGARLRFDRMQAEQMTTNLIRAGVVCREYLFTSAGANRLARGLWGALRDRALSLPDEDEVRAEFVAARLVETGPGTVKLVNPPGAHDDIVVAVGMVVADLTERAEISAGLVSVPRGRFSRTTSDARPALPRRLAVKQLAGKGPRGLPGGAIVVPDSANDPKRARR